MDPTTFATAYAFSTGVGLRPFMTLALASLAVHFNYIHVSHAFLGVGSGGVTLLLAALAVTEAVADKVPVVDHTLHAFHFALKPVLAAILVDGTLPALGPGDAGSYALAGAAALNAVGVHVGVASIRGASSAMTLGMGNPLISIVEDVLALLAAGLGILLPFLGALLALIITLALVLLAREVITRARAVRPQASGVR